MKHQAAICIMAALSGLGLGPAARAATAPPASDAATTIAGAPAAIPVDSTDDGMTLWNGSAWRFVPQATAMVTYDDNVFISSSNKTSDTYFQLAPGLAFGLGDFRGQVTPYAPIPHMLAETGEEDLPRINFLYIDYTPDFELLTEHPSQNTVNEDVRIAGQEQTDLWRLYGAFHYQLVTEPSIYLGTRTRQIYYTAHADGSYQVTGKLNTGVAVDANRDQETGGYTQDQGKVTGFVDYEQSEKTTVGIGLAGGDLHQQSDSDQAYFQALLRAHYHLTEKIGFYGNVGSEFRSLGDGAGSRDGLVFDVAGDYAASESTTFTASARRSTIGAIEYRGVDIWESVYQGGVRQRVGPGFVLTGTGGLVWDQYAPYAQNVVLNRRDEYYFFRAAVGHDLTKRGTAQIGFEHRDNDSSVSAYRFTENLLTLNLSFLF